MVCAASDGRRRYGRLHNVRLAIDYGPELRDRTGVGEYIHRHPFTGAKPEPDDTAVHELLERSPCPHPQTRAAGVRIADRRIPVRALNFAWHRLGWPPVEAVAGGAYDVAHSPHPLLMPTRTAAQVVTIHDLHFLAHPERTGGEIRRDYGALAESHASRADRIIVSSRYAAGEVARLLRVPAAKVAVCPAGAPAWERGERQGAGVAERYILFMGTLEARKNVGGLLTAYEKMIAEPLALPKLVLAGAAGPDAVSWLDRINRPPLAGRVDYLGYVAAERREALFKGACVFVLPSFEEGFGLPVLEAMTAGVPVIASNRGALPEVIGDAGNTVDPEDFEAIARGIARVINDRVYAETLTQRGFDRARQFTWERTAHAVRQAHGCHRPLRRARGAYHYAHRD